MRPWIQNLTDDEAIVRTTNSKRRIQFPLQKKRKFNLPHSSNLTKPLCENEILTPTSGTPVGSTWTITGSDEVCFIGCSGGFKGCDGQLLTDPTCLRSSAYPCICIRACQGEFSEYFKASKGRLTRQHCSKLYTSCQVLYMLDSTVRIPRPHFLQVESKLRQSSREGSVST